MGKMTVSNRCGDKKRPPVQWRDKKRLVIISDLVPGTTILVGGIPTPLKNMKVSWDDYSQYMEKIKFMFQTTNQLIIVLHSFATIICPTSRIFQVFFSQFFRRPRLVCATGLRPVQEKAETD